MEKKTYRTTINAQPEKVWKTLWDNGSYDEWAKVFSVNQPINTDWKKGSRVQFMDLNGDGMISEVAENNSPERMSFRHLGIVNKGVPDLESDTAKEWVGAKESYTLQPLDGKTELVVETDLTDDFVDFFDEKWPQALQRIKQLSEE